MHTVRLELLPDNYNNPDVYPNLLSYVFSKSQIGGYGFFPYELESIIKQLTACEQFYPHHAHQKIWHFIITFDQKINTTVLYTLANTVALHFAPYYQILFGVDTHGIPHLHFAVNTYPVCADSPVLDSASISQYLQQIIQLLSREYPTYKTVLQLHERNGN